jgi:hypothetical protein
MKIEDYLNYLQNSSESIFPMDYFNVSRPKVIRKSIYSRRIKEQKNESGIMRALIDFDGPIHKYSKGYYDGTIYDDPTDGCKEFIDWLKSLGFEIVIFTSRASESSAAEFGQDVKNEVAKVETWLKDHDIYFDLITAEKLAAMFYIDDRGIHFDNWENVKNEIKNRMNL